MSNNGGQSSNSDEFKDQQRQMWENAAAGWQAR
jgi:enediyne biosynthesis protein CalE5